MVVSRIDQGSQGPRRLRWGYRPRVGSDSVAAGKGQVPPAVSEDEIGYPGFRIRATKRGRKGPLETDLRSNRVNAGRGLPDPGEHR